MEQPKYLIDTNAIIDYWGQKLPTEGMIFMDTVIDAIPQISIITKIEILGFTAPDEHYKLLTDFMDDAAIFDLTNDVVDATITIRKNYKIKLPDAIIAATALVYNLVLISRNTSDFKNIEGLTFIDPHGSRKASL